MASITPFWNVVSYLFALLNVLKGDGALLKQKMAKNIKDIHNIHFRYFYYFNSASSAIYITLKSFNIGKGDKVIIPSFTCRSVLFSLLKTGATPVLSDIDDDYNLDLERVLNYKDIDSVKAVVVPNMYGKLNKKYHLLKKIRNLGIRVIEDNAVSFGSSYKQEILSDAVIYSFNIGKVVNASGGGVVFLRDDLSSEHYKILPKDSILNESKKALRFLITLRYKKLFARTIRLIKRDRYDLSLNTYYSNRDSFIIKNEEYFSVRSMSTLSLSLAYSQIKRFNILKDHLEKIYRYYDEAFHLCCTYGANEVPNYCLLCVNEADRYSLGSYFSHNAVEVYWSYYPIHKIDLYKNLEKIGELDVTDNKWGSFLYLPLNFYVDKKDVDYIYSLYLDHNQQNAQ